MAFAALVTAPSIFRASCPASLPSRDFLLQEATFHGWDELPQPGKLVESAGYYSHPGGTQLPKSSLKFRHIEVLDLRGNELAFWGGDLPSLTSKLDYIDGLGTDLPTAAKRAFCFCC